MSKQKFNIITYNGSNKKYKVEQVEGEFIEHDNPLNLKFFIHKPLEKDTNHNYYKWLITEFSTGTVVCNGKTKNEIIREFKQIPYYNDFTLTNELKDHIDNFIKRYGLANKK